MFREQASQPHLRHDSDTATSTGIRLITSISVALVGAHPDPRIRGSRR